MKSQYKKIITIVGLGAVLAFVFLFSGNLFTKEEYVGAKSDTANVIESLRGVSASIPFSVEKPEEVKAIYMTSWVAGTDSLRRDLIDFVDGSEINSVVIDIKDTSGMVSFYIDNKYLKKLDGFDARIENLQVVLDELHHKGIYVIGRISVFQDTHATDLWSNKIVRNGSGDPWKDKSGNVWMDPGAEVVWEYNAILANESLELGFDEINFDYVRYPEEWGIEEAKYPESGERLIEETKDDVLKGFFEYISQEVDKKEKKISVSFNKRDIDGLMVIAKDYVDIVSPILYPSSFDKGYNGYDNPSHYPYEVIYETMKNIKENFDPGQIRPWLQDFNLGATYGESEISLQQKALSDLGINNWMMWDPSNRYTKDAY